MIWFWTGYRNTKYCRSCWIPFTSGFHVVAMAEEKHATRAMLDGQIHDIYKVGDTIRRVKNSLERQIGFALTDVCIAAAGRVLKTVNASAEYAFEMRRG